RFGDIEDGVAFTILRQRENRLGRLHDLPDLEVSGSNHTCGAGVHFGVVERLAAPSQLRFRRIKRALCGSQLLLRLVVSDPRGEATREKLVLPIERGLGAAPPRFGFGY